MQHPAIELTKELISRPSITPNDAGCQELIIQRLTPLGFQCHRLLNESVTNLWAQLGHTGPTVVFAGHTDVVPPGPQAEWITDPFTPHIEKGRLYGRGACDMKGGLAAMLCAVEQFLKEHTPSFSLAFLITSDEEGPAIHGTQHVLSWLEAEGIDIDYCMIAEPSSSHAVGDTIKPGRRGSMSGHLNVLGTQGHVAYPHLAKNPIHHALAGLHALTQEAWCQGNEAFPATGFQIVRLQAGASSTGNVIPGHLEVEFNFRYSTELTPQELQARVEALLLEEGLCYELEWHVHGLPFLTTDQPFIEAVQSAVAQVCGQRPEISTAGGSSDGRFIAQTGAHVVELGLCNATAHKANEHVRVADIETLTQMYYEILKKLTF